MVLVLIVGVDHGVLFIVFHDEFVYETVELQCIEFAYSHKSDPLRSVTDTASHAMKIDGNNGRLQPTSLSQ